jgi:hypothetical protein
LFNKRKDQEVLVLLKRALLRDQCFPGQLRIIITAGKKIKVGLPGTGKLTKITCIDKCAAA